MIMLAITAQCPFTFGPALPTNFSKRVMVEDGAACRIASKLNASECRKSSFLQVDQDKLLRTMV